MNGELGNITATTRKRGRPRKQPIATDGNPTKSTEGVNSAGTGDQSRTDSRAGNRNSERNSRDANGARSGEHPVTATEKAGQNVEIPGEAQAVDWQNLFSEPPKKRRTRTKKADTSVDSKAIASLIIDTVDLFTTAKLGASAAFQPTEKLLIQPSLEHIITRYGSAAEKLSAWVDPVLLVGGLVLYATRISSLVAENRQDLNSVVPFNNGYNPAEDVQDLPPVYGASPDIHDILSRE